MGSGPELRTSCHQPCGVTDSTLLSLTFNSLALKDPRMHDSSLPCPDTEHPFLLFFEVATEMSTQRNLTATYLGLYDLDCTH